MVDLKASQMGHLMGAKTDYKLADIEAAYWVHWMDVEAVASMADLLGGTVVALLGA